MMPLPFIAFYFEQTLVMWFSIIFMGFILGWQIFAYGFFGEKFIDTHMNIDVVPFYGKKTLIFIAIAWAMLITGVSVALYLKLP